MKTNKGYARRMADYWDNFEEQINDVSDVSDIEGSVNGKLIYIPIKNYNVSGDDYQMDLDHLYSRMHKIRISAKDGTEYKSIKLFGVRVGDVKKLDSDLWISYNDFFTDYCKEKVLKDKDRAFLDHKKFIFQAERVSDKLQNYGYSLNRLFTNDSFKLNNIDSDHLINKVVDDWRILERDHSVEMLHLYRNHRDWVKENFTINKSVASDFAKNVDSLVSKYPLLIYISVNASTWHDLNAKSTNDGLCLLDETEKYIQICDNQGVGE